VHRNSSHTKKYKPQLHEIKCSYFGVNSKSRSGELVYCIGQKVQSNLQTNLEGQKLRHNSADMTKSSAKKKKKNKKKFFFFWI